MKSIVTIIGCVLLLASCSNNSNQGTAKTFCDTACNTDTLKFEGEHRFNPMVSISQKNCLADTLSWTHDGLPSKRQMQLPTLLNNPVRVNKAAVSCFIIDTSYAWLSFNDCVTGRGYLLKLPFNKKQNINKISSAINSFDKKFVVPDDLRAYADYSTIYVVDINSDKKEQMTFKEQYNIDFNTVHDVIDSVNISRDRIFVLLKKNGQDVPIEKKIKL